MAEPLSPAESAPFDFELELHPGKINASPAESKPIITPLHCFRYGTFVLLISFRVGAKSRPERSSTRLSFDPFLPAGIDIRLSKSEFRLSYLRAGRFALESKQLCIGTRLCKKIQVSHGARHNAERAGPGVIELRHQLNIGRAFDLEEVLFRGFDQPA